MDRREFLLQAAIAATWSPSLVRAVEAGGALHETPAASLLDERQRRTVSLLAEMIIPKTDTPGAVEAGVPAFIEQIYSSWYTPAERAIFAAGLDELDRFSQRHYGRKFLQGSDLQRGAALADAERQTASYGWPTGGNVQSKQVDAQSPFFIKLKELTVLGYYTSEVGATTELQYNPGPGRFDGGVTLAQVGGRQWST